MNENAGAKYKTMGQARQKNDGHWQRNWLRSSPKVYETHLLIWDLSAIDIWVEAKALNSSKQFAKDVEIVQSKEFEIVCDGLMWKEDGERWS